MLADGHVIHVDNPTGFAEAVKELWGTSAAVRNISAERIAGELRQANRGLHGTLHGAEVVDVSPWTVQTVMHLPFGGRASRSEEPDGDVRV